MDKQYKIGDIAKLLGIPAQTIRFYEDKGLIKPKRDKEDGYRYFDAWDVNYLMDIMYFKAMEFSLQSSEEILNSDSLEEIHDKFEAHEFSILKQIEKYKKILRYTTMKKQRIKNIAVKLGKFEVVTRKEFVFYRQRLNNTFQSLKGSNICILQAELKEWTNLLPEAIPAFLVPQETIKDCVEEINYWWGWAMVAEDAVDKGIELKEPNEFLHSVQCIYTIFYAEGKGTFAQCLYNQVVIPTMEQGYHINGDIYGQLIIKPHDGGGLKRYFEVWVPISNV